MPCIRLACCGTRGTSEKPSADKNDDQLGSQYSSSSELSNPTVVNTNCCISPENHPPKFLGSRANCCIRCSCFHSVYFDTLASTSLVVEHLAQVKSLRHIQQAASRLLLLYFALQKDTCGFIAKTCSKTAQVKASRQPMTNSTVHYPQNSELLGPTIVYMHRQDLFENSASESIVSAHDKLDGPLPPKIGVVGTNYCIY